MQTFSSAGVTIAFVDISPDVITATPPVLLIHGFASSHKINWLQTGWIEFLRASGRRVIAFDNRGHGESQKLTDPNAYATPIMAQDARALLDHLHITKADIIGYSMGARIAAFLALAHPGMVRRIVLGGLGIHLVQGYGLPMGIAEAMEAATLDELSDPMQRMFRAFAQSTKSDLAALAACIRGSRQALSAQGVGQIACKVLVAVGTKDAIAGDPHKLAALIAGAQALDIVGRDHNLAVGDKSFKAGVLAFLNAAD